MIRTFQTPQTQTSQSKWISARELSQYTNVPKHTIYKQVRKNQIPHYRATDGRLSFCVNIDTPNLNNGNQILNQQKSTINHPLKPTPMNTPENNVNEHQKAEKSPMQLIRDTHARMQALEDLVYQNNAIMKQLFSLNAAYIQDRAPSLEIPEMDYVDIPPFPEKLLGYIYERIREFTLIQQTPLASRHSVEQYIDFRFPSDAADYLNWLNRLAQLDNKESFSSWLGEQRFADEQKAWNEIPPHEIINPNGSRFINEAYNVYKHIRSFSFNQLLNP